MSTKQIQLCVSVVVANYLELFLVDTFHLLSVKFKVLSVLWVRRVKHGRIIFFAEIEIVERA